MITFYKVGHHNELIKEVQAEKETKQFVYIKRQGFEIIDRISKKSHFANYFGTKKEAYDFILNEAIKKRNKLDIQLRLANNFIEEIKKLNL